jgi:hypothetical protein
MLRIDRLLFLAQRGCKTQNKETVCLSVCLRNLRFVALSTSTHHWTMSWTTWIWSTSACPISLSNVQILPSQLRLIKGTILHIHFMCVPCLLYSPLISFFCKSYDVYWMVSILFFLGMFFFFSDACYFISPRSAYVLTTLLSYTLNLP